MCNGRSGQFPGLYELVEGHKSQIVIIPFGRGLQIHNESVATIMNLHTSPAAEDEQWIEVSQRMLINIPPEDSCSV